jgi:hypothetical protein
MPILPRAARRRGRPVRVVLVEIIADRAAYCARLGIPFTYNPGPGLMSMEAIADPPAYDRARTAVRYDTFPARWCFLSNTATGSI